MNRRRTLSWLAAALVAAALAGWWLGTTTAGSSQETTTVTVTAAPTGSIPTLPDATGTDPASGLPWIEVGELPPEARETLALIAAGGPFPYERDGAVFRNRERLLPDARQGYYREYTVETPGSDDRGARRIVAGAEGERYYTDDHYASFRRIEP